MDTSHVRARASRWCVRPARNRWRVLLWLARAGRRPALCFPRFAHCRPGVSDARVMRAGCTPGERSLVQTKLRRVRKGNSVKPGMRKVASVKTMRVATVFTGAVACAAAFAPAAHAATGHQAAPDGKTLTDATTLTVPRPGTMHGFHPDISAAPQTSVAKTCATTPRYVHLLFGRRDTCLGHLGYESWDAGFPVSKICGGNNAGSYGNTSGRTAKFGPGTTFAHLPWAGVTSLRWIHITAVYPSASSRCSNP